MDEAGYAAIVLAGGAGRRMGGRHKPSIPVAGVPMIDRVLGAVSDAMVRIVVGPDHRVPAGVLVVREDPPGGGPVAGIAAGLAELSRVDNDPDLLVAVLAGDQPLLTRPAVGLLLRTAAASPTAGGAVFVGDGRPQLLCGVWRAGPLHQRLRELGDPAGVAVRDLLGRLRFVPTPAPDDLGTALPPWYDCDTPAAVATAERWLREGRDGGY